MKLKFNIITILIALIVSTLLLSIIINRIQLNSRQTIEIEDKFFFDKVSVDTIEKIQIITLDEEINLIRDESLWKLEENEADESKIQSLLSLLSEAKVDQMVSNNPDNLAEFGLNEESVITLKLYRAGDNLVEQIQFGYYAAGGKIYAKRKDKNNVYTINANIYSLINSRKDTWIKEDIDETDPLE